MRFIIFCAVAALAGDVFGYIVGKWTAEQEYEAKRAELEIDEDEDEWDKLFKEDLK
jgi:membrane protein DedA with SNARE-associated domain